MAPGRAAATRDVLGKDVYAAHYAAGASLTLDSMAVMNRVVTPAGPFGQRTRNALMAEAARRYVDAGGTKDEFVRDQDEILQGRGGP